MTIEDYFELLRNTNRDGMDKLINFLEEMGMNNAPASSKFHMSKAGGLLEHSANVYKYAGAINAALNTSINPQSIVIVSLLHDIGKLGDYGKANYIENILKSGKQSEAEPYKTNKELSSIPHEIRSVFIIERFITLTEAEEFAILHHNGMYSDLKYALNGKETPLQMILHFADMWASRVVEMEE